MPSYIIKEEDTVSKFTLEEGGGSLLLEESVAISIPTVYAIGSTGGSEGGITPGLPSGWVKNDIFVLPVETDDEPVTFPGGWNSIFSRAQGGSTRLQIAWRRATDSESAPSIADAGDHQVGAIIGIRGCIQTIDPFDVIDAGANGVGDSPSAPAITTTKPYCLVIGFITTSGATSFSAWTNSVLSNFGEILDINTSGGAQNAGSVGAAAGGMASPGSTGTITTDPIQSNPGWVMTQIALIPEPLPLYRPLRNVMGSGLRYS